MAGMHTTYNIERFYDCDEGLIAIPRASDSNNPQPPVFIRVHDPITYLIIAWIVGKIGSVPDLPSPRLFDQSNVYMSRVVGALENGKTSEGLDTWTIAGEFRYVLIEPLGLTSAIPTGKLPWEPGTPMANTIPASAWKQGILDQGGGGSKLNLQMGIAGS